ncbi:BREX-1 system adenine-specific DNA-methyltransferase PglX [Planococcus lenghuensis]|uniref:site-specific DNA-methyltransferase (adenine-specific) n=1 Tax=Planococcus lenghuensis TaxID=2213202 RepID=A0A1Q2KVS4_9BACL|nr:BREX-1 system adenine-specific DNA-methyltransferase PglX [Planococcus lenghuensis]AQQ52243.1 SAM-dependent methyltransferase [Planococcus lenghuensis]
MNKTALKRFATEARRELLEKVELQARKIGITAEAIQQADVESSDAVFIDGKQLSDIERRQRNKLVARINDIGFRRVIDEAAYTWFNRFIALRFMEVNDYLPTKVRVLSTAEPDSTEPDMIKEALSLDLDIDKEKVYEWKVNNNTDALFKYLIKQHCNYLNRYMPFMFETIEDYTEILFPEGLLGTDSFVRRMTDTDFIPEDNWNKVEIVGWLYQYYISEENERVIRAKKRYKAEELPFATQLFTPEWIVRYMVQNALGRYWIESHPEHEDLIQNWEFFLKSQEPDDVLQEKLTPYINKDLNVEDIKCFDPAMGSGHILIYMFDVLYEIYSRCGYSEREIPRLIIENNLYGLDIDDRAYQLASFSTVMKALQYNKRFLRSIVRDGLALNFAAIQETNAISDEEVAFLAGESSGKDYESMKEFISQFRHAKAIGSLIKLQSHDENFLYERVAAIETLEGDLFEQELRDRTLNLYKQLIHQASLMSGKHDVFITNPPYAGNKYLTPEVADYLKENYLDVKADLFSSFFEYSFDVTKENGQIGFMSPFVWMFISSFEKFRQKMIGQKTISSLIQLEYSGFEGATVPICTFTLRNYNSELLGEYVKLTDFRGSTNQPTKTLEAVTEASVDYRYSFDQRNFSEIPGSPIAYWLSEDFVNIFIENQRIGEVAVTKQGSTIGDNNSFLRLWFEVSNMKNEKWVPCLKGGSYRKWYGNHDYLINWENNGARIKSTGRATIRSEKMLFREGISWSNITSGKSSFRIMEPGYFFESTSSVCFPKENNLYILGMLNTKISESVTKILNPTLHLQSGNVAAMPYLYDEKVGKEVERLVTGCIEIAKFDWDSYENSWNFKIHPLIRFKNKNLKQTFQDWEQKTNHLSKELRQKENRINEIFIESAKLNDEFTPEVDERDLGVRKADIGRDIRSFISYTVGCSFGRYSLDEEGLVHAGGDFNPSRYKSVPVNKDNILPILPDAYFEDDIVTRLVDFVQTTFGDETLEENLDFIADAVSRKKNETAREALRRYFLNDFYKDHVQVYKKRPIYWLFTSGKEKAFNCLIYMHRYDKTTLSRIRTDYLHEVQTRMDSEKKDLLQVIEGASTAQEVTAAKKELKVLDKKIDELKAYDEQLHHMADMQIEIDLDDGVKVNYAKFDGLVAKI